MTDQATRVTPAGWYDDPSSSDKVRWWNGIAWTDHVEAKPDLAGAAQAQVDELEAGFAEPALAPLRPRGHSASTTTNSSWLMAFSPVWFVITVIAALTVELYYVQTPLVFLMLLVPYALCVMWGFMDARKLRRWGHTPPSGVWAIFGPLVYLIVRKVKVRGWGPLATLVGILVAFGLAHVALWTTDVQKPLSFAIQIQTEIRDDLVGSGEASRVACPPIADTLTVGALYTCDVTMADGSHRELWVSIDTAEGDYSYSYAIN